MLLYLIGIDDPPIDLDVAPQKLTFDVRPQDKIHNPQCEIYYLCMDDKNDRFVGCHRNKKGKSYIECLEQIGVKGGDWFHWKCNGFKILTKKIKWLFMSKMFKLRA